MSAQVGLELAAQNLERRALADTVCSDQPKNLARSGHGKTMQLEAIRAIAVGDLALEVGGQVDDGNGVEGAFFGTDTTTDAERLGDERKTRFGRYFDAQLAATDDGTRLLALLTTFARTTLQTNMFSMAGYAGYRKHQFLPTRTLVVVHDGDTRLEVSLKLI